MFVVRYMPYIDFLIRSSVLRYLICLYVNKCLCFTYLKYHYNGLRALTNVLRGIKLIVIEYNCINPSTNTTSTQNTSKNLVVLAMIF